MLLDYCRAPADTAAGDAVPMDLSMLDEGKGDKNGKGDENKSEGGKGEKEQRRRQDRGKGKSKDNAKATEYIRRILPSLQGFGPHEEGLLDGTRAARAGEGHRISVDSDYAGVATQHNRNRR